MYETFVENCSHFVLKYIAGLLRSKRIPNSSHKVYLYSTADMLSLRKELSKFGDDFTHQAKNFSVQEIWDNIKNKISSLMDEFIPQRILPQDTTCSALV